MPNNEHLPPQPLALGERCPHCGDGWVEPYRGHLLACAGCLAEFVWVDAVTRRPL